jgi:hypothetical protein
VKFEQTYLVLGHCLRCFGYEPVGKSTEYFALVLVYCGIFLYQVAEQGLPELVFPLFRECSTQSHCGLSMAPCQSLSLGACRVQFHTFCAPSQLLSAIELCIHFMRSSWFCGFFAMARSHNFGPSCLWRDKSRRASCICCIASMFVIAGSRLQS